MLAVEAAVTFPQVLSVLMRDDVTSVCPTSNSTQSGLEKIVVMAFLCRES